MMHLHYSWDVIRNDAGSRRKTVNDAKSKLSRRHFLLAVGAGGAATAAAIAAKAIVPAVPSPATNTSGNEKRRGKGYQETAHVRSYYNTTKV